MPATVRPYATFSATLCAATAHTTEYDADAAPLEGMAMDCGYGVADQMRPASSLSKPAIWRSSVVFPQPEAPRIAMNSPLATSSNVVQRAKRAEAGFVT
jgi:hypothetical protein